MSTIFILRPSRGIVCKKSRDKAVWDSSMVTLNDIKQAQTLLQGITVRTPLLEWTGVASKRKLFLKLENLQPIGAFKLRGAYNKVASLSAAERSRGVISYSSGNHGQGVAYAARALGVKAVIVMPENAPKVKLESTAALGAEIVIVGPGSEERRVRAEQLAAAHGYAIVPPYNDEKIIAGQGTVGLEILEDLPEVQTVLVPVGGGGLISGVSAALKLTNPKVNIIGVEPELAGDARASLHSGRIVTFAAEQVTQTLADGLRTQSIGEVNFEHIRAYVDEIVSVKEDEIREATRALSANPRTIAEPSGAVTLAAFMFHSAELPRTRSNVAVISGGNIDPEFLAEIRKG
jgi:threonine dehydratase